jgi:hypothetical protein
MDPHVGALQFPVYHPPAGGYLGTHATRDSLGLRLVGLDGHLLGSLGMRPPQEMGDNLWAVTAPDGTIWSLSSTRWRIENWDVSGTRLRSFHGDFAWAEPQFNGLLGMSFDDAGHAFLYGIDRAGTTVNRHGAVAAEPAGFSAIVEVIDVASGTLIARRVVPHAILAPPWAGGPSALAEAPSGNVRIQILHPRLVEQ